MAQTLTTARISGKRYDAVGLEPPRTAEALTGVAREERSAPARPVAPARIDPVCVARPLVLGGASI